jgi:hypothetical protein
MEKLSIQDLSAPRAKSFEPLPSGHPIHTSSYEFSPSLLDMVQGILSFSESTSKSPYTHLWDFEHVCACYTIAGMSHETFRWKLFPFSLLGDAKQWYTQNVCSIRGSCNILVGKFCQKYFPPSSIVTLLLKVNFCQPSHEFTFGVGIDLISKLMIQTPMRCQVRTRMSFLEFIVYAGF